MCFCPSLSRSGPTQWFTQKFSSLSSLERNDLPLKRWLLMVQPSHLDNYPSSEMWSILWGSLLLGNSIPCPKMSIDQPCCSYNEHNLGEILISFFFWKKISHKITSASYPSDHHLSFITTQGHMLLPNFFLIGNCCSVLELSFLPPHLPQSPSLSIFPFSRTLYCMDSRWMAASDVKVDELGSCICSCIQPWFWLLPLPVGKLIKSNICCMLSVVCHK